MAAPLTADAFTPLFTKQYVRRAGPPAVAFDNFAACDPSGTFRLVVLNGPGRNERVSSASITVNGVEVVRESDFSQRAGKIERRIPNIASDNRLEVQLRSKPGAAIQVTIEGAQTCGPRITWPPPDSTLTESVVIVRGTVPMRSDGNVGVTVNGVPAHVESGRFAAIVELDPELTTLTARAVDLSGEIGSHTVTVAVEPSIGEPSLRLDGSPAGGAAPLTVGFGLTGLAPILGITLDFDGDGTADFQGESLIDHTFTYAQPGIYVPTAQASDDEGQTHTASTIVSVSDTASLDARLQAVWRGLKDALRIGDLSAAGRFIHSETSPAYADLFHRFTPGTLANIDQHMTAIQLVEVGPGGAQYEMLRERDGQSLSFAVWFQLDRDGLWRLRRF